jgi:sugar phosphate isomerase/epimerase
MKIGIQLYTLRDFVRTKKEFIDTLDRVAEIGYEAIEIAAVGCMEGDSPEVSAEECAKLAAERNLAVPATHCGWSDLAGNVCKVIDWHLALGAKIIAIPVPPEGVHEGGIQAYRDWLPKGKEIADKLAEHGLTLSYHNHAMEFERMAPKGERPFDVMVNEAPWLAFELDTHWVHHSGTEVVPTIQRLKGRLPCVHLKDTMPYGWEVSFAPVGEGNLNWNAILPAFKAAGSEWVFVEQDSCKRDHFDSIASSFRFVKSQLA